MKQNAHCPVTAMSWRDTLCRVTATSWRDALCRGDVSAVQLVRDALRMAEEKKDLNAYITLCPDRALRQAEIIDQKRRAGEELPPLAGVPFAVKDNLAVSGVRMTCGSKMLENFVSPYTATAVRRLEAAGGIVIGKCNLDEFAMGDSTKTSYFGTVKNPGIPGRTAGGSSGGSAAAVAAGTVPFALATDTGGSVREPAAYCGLVGLRPGYGAVSRYGMTAYASSLDTVGVMANTVRDCDTVFSLMAGKDPFDQTTVEGHRGADKNRFRIGIPVAEYENGSVAAAITDAQEQLRDAGCELVPILPAQLKELPYAGAIYEAICFSEAAENLQRFDGVRYGYRPEAADSAGDFFAASRSEGFGQTVKARLLFGTYLSGADGVESLRLARQHRTVLRGELLSVLSRVDCILCPTVTQPAPLLASEEERDLLPWSCAAALAGLPALTVPCGSFEDGSPCGVQLVGGTFCEQTLFTIGKLLQE